MSFFSDNRGCCPGPIQGNPLNGLCEKVCILTKKVFDACIKQVAGDNLMFDISLFSPPNPVFPLQFVSGNCIAGQAVIEGLTVERFEDKPCFARVRGELVIPVVINYIDANGDAGVANTVLRLPQDVIMFVPKPSIVPFQIEAFINCVIEDGEFISNEQFRADACIVVIMRVTVEAEMLVPTYGYCEIPPCQDFVEEICPGVSDLPLYPTNVDRCCSED